MDVQAAIRAGDFVQRAYNAYDSLGGDQSNLTPSVALPPGFDLVARISMEDFLSNRVIPATGDSTATSCTRRRPITT
jgi:hypothetical protein